MSFTFVMSRAMFVGSWLASLLSASFVLGDIGATPTKSFRLPAGFEIDLIYEVPLKEQGSWVCITSDKKGGLLASDQYGKVYRVTPPPVGAASSETKVEPLGIDVGMAQGLLVTKDGLYVNVNAGENAGLFRFQDTNNDGTYDTKEYLIPLNGGGEHGPHAVIEGPDGRLYLAAGNQTQLPKRIDASRVPRHWGEDHMLGRMPDGRGFMAGVPAPGGFILSFNPDGSDIEIVATGFRNQYDIDFSPTGELFTYDADMEWDVGTPWYRPTRVNHVISGAEFGWRNGTGKWPEYFADSFGAVVNIGYGSPTGITFGTGAKFPAKYQNSLLISDWSYGVIYAVHLKPDGSSYAGEFEPFVSASPMPVTDLIVDPSTGALYFTIGGRGVQSAMYRVRYTGVEDCSPAVFPDTSEAKQARETRRKLEAMHRGEGFNLELSAQNVGSSDRALRTSARIALEQQDASLWRGLLTKPNNAQAAITLAVALARKGDKTDQEIIQNQLLSLDWDKLNQTEKLELLRAYQLSFLRLGEGTDAMRAKITASLDPHFPTPAEDSLIDRELARILIYLNAPNIVERCVNRMQSTPSADEQIHYAFCLREATEGWNDKTRREYFQWFYDIATARGGASFGGFIENIRQVAIKNLTDAQKQQLGELVGPPPAPRDPLENLAPRSVVKAWTVEELEPAAQEKTTGFDFEKGKLMFAVAQCYKCHRMGGQGGIQGPDLTSAGGRFSVKDLLVATIEPSKEISDQYQASQFLLEDDTVIVGRVANLNGDNLMIQTNMLDPGNFTNLKRQDIVEVRQSQVSPMPSGLLDTLSKEEIIDLLAYLRAGGNPKHSLYMPK